MEGGISSKAILVTGEDHHDFTLANINVSDPGEGEIRVKMIYASFSPNDSLHESKLNGVQYPFISGYDGVGKIESVGEGVTDFTEGDHVALFLVPQRFKEHNYEKTNVGDDFAKKWRDGTLWSSGKHLEAYKGEDGSKLNGFMGLGTWSEYVNVPETHLVKLPGQPDHADSAIGSVLATGMLTATKAVSVEEGSNCAVFGSNTVAVITAYALKKGHSCDKVIVVGDSSIKDLIESLEIQFILDEGETTDIQKQLMEISPDGYDYTFESSSFQRWGTVALEVCHKGFGECLLLSQP